MTSVTEAAYMATLKDAIRSQPRSQQKRIGPSELGTECDHCLAAKLAGWDKQQDVAWLPWTGTAVHAALDPIFRADPRYLVETEVMVGWVGDGEVWGTSDLYDVETGTVIDHKYVGASTLTGAKKGPSAQYFAQLQCYGMGFRNAGYDVKNVAISYLPRQAVSLSSAIWWEAPFDPAAALQTLSRANQFADKISTLRTIAPEAVDRWISGLPRATKCWDCDRFSDRITEPSRLLKEFAA